MFILLSSEGPPSPSHHADPPSADPVTAPVAPVVNTSGRKDQGEANHTTGSGGFDLRLCSAPLFAMSHIETGVPLFDGDPPPRRVFAFV